MGAQDVDEREPADEGSEEAGKAAGAEADAGDEGAEADEAAHAGAKAAGTGAGDKGAGAKAAAGAEGTESAEGAAIPLQQTPEQAPPTATADAATAPTVATAATTAAATPLTAAAAPAPLPTAAPAPVAAPSPTNGSYFTYAFGLAAGALSAYALLRLAAHAQNVLVLVALSAFFAVSLNPIVTALTRQRRVPMPRWAAVLVVGIGVLGLVAGFLAVIVPPVDREVTALVHQVPHLLNEAQDRSTWLGRMEAKYHVFTKLESSVSSKSLGVNAVSGVVGAGKYVLDMLTSALAVVALTIYFLAGLPNVVNTVYRTVPASRRARARALGDEILTQVGRYMLGSALNASIAGLATFVWTAVLGIPYPAALGLLVALLDMLPVIGSTIGGAIVTLVALSQSVPIALATLAFYVAFRLTEDYVLLPKVMRHAVDVPPIATVVAVLIGGALMGIIGALMAIPTAAALKLVTEQILMPRLDRN